MPGLIEENRRRSRLAPEFELIDTGIFDNNRYFDVFAEYVKASPEDILINITVCNRGPETAQFHLLPTLWFRNTWSWGRSGEDYWGKPRLWQSAATKIRVEHESLGKYVFQRIAHSVGAGSGAVIHRKRHQYAPSVGN